MEAVAENVEEVLSPDQKATKLIRNYTLGGLGIGVIPLPLVDMAALVALQLKMLHDLSKVYEVPFNRSLGKSAVSTLLGGYLPVSLTGVTASSLAKFVPFVGTALAYTTQPLLCAAATYAVGKVFQQHFASGGTFLNFDPEQVRDYFQEQFEEGKNVAKDFNQSSTASSTT